MSSIFVSYASSDREIARRIVDCLAARGWEAWWDRQIIPGNEFDSAILEAIERAACVLVLWSDEALRSHWVKAEAREGLKRGLLVPALIRPIDIRRLPLDMRAVQCADLTRWRGDPAEAEFAQLCASLEAVRNGSTPVAADPTKLGRAPPTRAWAWVAGVVLTVATAAAALLLSMEQPSPSTVTVPHLIGANSTAARGMAEAAGLVVSGTSDGPSERLAPAGTVLEQQPASGTTVAAGTGVSLVVASENLRKVPDLTGMHLAAAIKILEDLKLQPGEIRRTGDAKARYALVTAQSVPAGTVVPKNADVDLQASVPLVKVPAVLEKERGTAVRLIEQAGLEVGEVVERTSSELPDGFVLEQKPAAGAAVLWGDKVRLIVVAPPRVDPDAVGNRIARAEKELAESERIGSKVRTLIAQGKAAADRVERVLKQAESIRAADKAVAVAMREPLPQEKRERGIVTSDESGPGLEGELRRLTAGLRRARSALDHAESSYRAGRYNLASARFNLDQAKNDSALIMHLDYDGRMMEDARRGAEEALAGLADGETRAASLLDAVRSVAKGSSAAN